MTPESPGAGPRARLAGIVLAAGGASRFGGPKQLARLAGESLVQRAARLALGCCPAGVVVVTGAFAAEVAAEVADLPVRLVRNDDWANGLAGSLRCGLDASPRGALAWMVLLCDQPAIDAADLERLVRAWEFAPQRAAAAVYAGVTGVPAIFPAALAARLRALAGERGAGPLLATLDDLAQVPMPAAARDVDTPDELASLLRR